MKNIPTTPAQPNAIAQDYDSLATMYERNAEKTRDPSEKQALLALAQKFRAKAAAQREHFEHKYGLTDEDQN